MKRVLIVEDVELNLDLLVQLLEDDYALLSATDGAMGVELASRERPDLILMDINLPGIDGFEATRLLRDDPATSHIKAALEAGKHVLLEKPLDVTFGQARDIGELHGFFS